jgi:hypothetical protein
MLPDKIRTFLFKCDECAMIISANFEEEVDIKMIHDDDMELECPCGGYCRVLRD